MIKGWLALLWDVTFVALYNKMEDLYDTEDD